MNNTVLLAFIVWAIDRDALHILFTKCWEMFQRDAWEMYKTYTNPNDTTLYCPNLVNKNYMEVMTDYTLFYAKLGVVSGVRDYGKYNKSIKNYKR